MICFVKYNENTAAARIRFRRNCMSIFGPKQINADLPYAVHIDRLSRFVFLLKLYCRYLLKTLIKEVQL